MSIQLENAVIAITGASSGIGRATALRLAREGAKIVAIARNEEALRSLAEECEMLGGRAMAAPADVTNEQALKDVVLRALETYGRIDVWINDAAVSVFGRFDEIPSEEFRRVIETNLFGYVHGVRAVLPYFREQGRGTIINVSSMVGKTSQPFASAYAISKAAILGLSESLRMELLDLPGIHVCTVLPGTIDTPIFQHAANFSGRAVKAMPPVHSAEDVAEVIVKTIQHPRREVFVDGMSKLATTLYQLAPQLTERLFARQVDKEHFQDAPSTPSQGNLYEPMREMSGVSGGWQQPGGGQSMSGKAVLGLAALGAGATWLLTHRRHRKGA